MDENVHEGLPTVEQMEATVLSRNIEAVAGRLERLARTIRAEAKFGLSRVGSEASIGRETYSAVAAMVVKEITVTLFNMPLQSLIEAAGRADHERGRAES